ncbi:secreted protein, partial [mine drainage metagenome]
SRPTASGGITEFNLTNGTSTTVAAGVATVALAWLPTGALAAADLLGAIYFLQPAGPGPLATPILSLAPSYVGVGANVTVRTQEGGGTGSYHYVYAGLPPGCASQNRSTFSCTPSASGTYRVEVTVTDATGAVANGSAYLWVRPSSLVSFVEDGLPAGTVWWVNLTDGLSLQSTASTVTALLVNGTLGYSIGVGAANWVPSVPSGEVSVAGAPTAVTTTFLELQPLSFVETGPPTGTSWRVSLSGSIVGSTTGSSFNVSILNGTYSYVAAVSGGGWVPVEGQVSVAGPTVVQITFIPWGYNITFRESGLPSGTSWWVNITSGTGVRSSDAQAVIYLTNGTYAWTATTAGGEWRGQAGSVVVAGNATAVSIAFVLQTYTITFSAPGLPSLDPVWVNVTGATPGAGTATGVTVALANGSYIYAASAGPEWEEVSG